MKTNIGVKYKLHQVLSLGPLPLRCRSLTSSAFFQTFGLQTLRPSDPAVGVDEDFIIHTLRFRSILKPRPKPRSLLSGSFRCLSSGCDSAVKSVPVYLLSHSSCCETTRLPVTQLLSLCHRLLIHSLSLSLFWLELKSGECSDYRDRIMLKLRSSLDHICAESSVIFSLYRYFTSSSSIDAHHRQSRRTLSRFPERSCWLEYAVMVIYKWKN